MLQHGTTVADATLHIEDEKMRTLVSDMLMNGQIIALLGLMRDLSLLGKAQYEELAAYLRRVSTL